MKIEHTTGSVVDAIADDADEAAQLKIKAARFEVLRKYIEDIGLTQAEAAKRMGVQRSRVGARPEYGWERPRQADSRGPRFCHPCPLRARAKALSSSEVFSLLATPSQKSRQSVQASRPMLHSFLISCCGSMPGSVQSA